MKDVAHDTPKTIYTKNKDFLRTCLTITKTAQKILNYEYYLANWNIYAIFVGVIARNVGQYPYVSWIDFEMEIEMKYYIAFWDESRGDEFDSWGSCIYYFEVDENDYVLKQLQIYENETVLKYKDDSILDDKYGGLTDQPLTKEDIELNGFPDITKEEFYKLWNCTQSINGVES